MIAKQIKNTPVKDEKRETKAESNVVRSVTVRSVTHSFPRPLFSAKSLRQ